MPGDIACNRTGLGSVAKVLEMLSGLLANIVAEAGGVTKMYDEFAGWCEDKF